MVTKLKRKKTSKEIKIYKNLLTKTENKVQDYLKYI